MILMSVLLVVSNSQLSGKHPNIKSSRKLDANLQETILLGFDNYSRIPYDNIVHNSTFYTYFLLKNWDDGAIQDLYYFKDDPTKTEFILDSNITYMDSKNGKDQIKFYCSINGNKRPPLYRDSKNQENFTLVQYFCQSAQITKDIPKKIRLNSNFTTIKLNGTYVDKVSSTAEAQEKDLVSLKNLTIFGNLYAAILRNATFVNQSPNYFKIRGKYTRYLYDSNNIELITIINGNPTKIQCKGKDEQDSTDDQYYYFLQPKSSGSFSNVDFGYTVGNFTKVREGSKIFIIDFQDGTNSTIIDNNYFKKSSKGLSKGVICAIAIPTILLTLGVGALVFFLSRRPLPPPQPIKNVMNNTVGIASSGVVVNQ
jgi:hypothetical protein